MLQAAIQRLRNRKNDDEQGFTLIELMVVVLIIAILIAFAIPTFLGARRRAQDRSAQSSLRNTLSAADTVFTDDQSYTVATDAILDGEEPSIDFVATGVPSTGPKVVSVEGAGDLFYAAAWSDAKNCFGMRSQKDTSAAANPPSGVGFAELDGVAQADCTATTAALAAHDGSYADEF